MKNAVESPPYPHISWRKLKEGTGRKQKFQVATRVLRQGSLQLSIGGSAMNTTDSAVDSSPSDMHSASRMPTLAKAQFADLTADGTLLIDDGERPVRMKNSDGTGMPLLRYGEFGADVIRFRSGEGVQTHVHEGDHILFVLRGRGILTFAGEEHSLYPGLCYLVPGAVDHAILASENLVLIAVGNQHRPLDSFERMVPVSSRNREE
jgi:mannose-6-phosphate isomerase-like protein (cupin superfamily)